MRRIIFHVDVNSAFLSWEAVYRLRHLGGTLDLRTIPSAVGGDQEKRHGIILAKSIPAKKYKVQTGEPIVDARAKCPQLMLVPPNYELYQRSSKAMIRILSEYADQIEKYSIDEAFLDMTGICQEPKETAEKLKEQIFRELGFTVNVGISSNKLLAKMASDFEKPDRVHTLWPEEIPKKMWPLPVRDLFLVGGRSQKKLEALGIFTIGQLAKAPEPVLYAALKSHGLQIRKYANGIDESEVVTVPPPNKGYGNSLTTPADVTDPETARLYLLSLAETVSARLRADGAMVRTVEVSLRDCHLKNYHHQRQLPAPTDLTGEIYRTACQCFGELWNGVPLRHLGIHTSGVTRTLERQLCMFDPVDYEKCRRAEAAVDLLRKRFGQDAVKRACFVEAPGKEGPFADHMGGGISREKRSVDYTKERIL